MEITENWETLLYRVVNLEDIDPWNIDIVNLSDKYLEYIQNKGIDFKLSGKVVLAVAILLRMKAEILAAEEEEEPEENFSFDSFDTFDYSEEEIPEVKPRVKKVPKRKATFNELVGALKSALKIKKKRPKKVKKSKKEVVVLEENFVEEIEHLYKELLKLKGKLDKIKFSRVVKKRNGERVIGKFLPLLHLAQNRRVSLDQEKLFGEIYITLTE